MNRRKLIFYELNEVPFRVIDDYCKRHPDAFFAKHCAKLYQYETHADASRPLASNGVKVGLFGSLHSHGSYPSSEDLKNSYRFYVPDVFPRTTAPTSSALSSFQKFCLSMVRKSARNISTAFEWWDGLNVLRQTGASDFNRPHEDPTVV